MADTYPIESQLVIDASGKLIPGGKVYVYDSDDTANTTLLALTDPNGLPIPNPITASASSITPEIRTPVMLVKMVGENGAQLTVLSAKGVVQKAEAAEAFVKGIGVSNVTTAAPGELASVALDENGQFSFVLPQGQKGRDGAAVLPTDTAIADAIKDLASATSKALNDRFGGATDTQVSAERHKRAYGVSKSAAITPAVNASAQLIPVPAGLRYRIMAKATVGPASEAAFGSAVATIGAGASTLTGFKGIGIDVGTNRPVAYDSGVVSLSTDPLPAGDYMLMVVVDELQYSLVIRAVDGSKEYRRNVQKAAAPTHWGAYWTAAGVQIGKAALNPSSATITPRSEAGGTGTQTFTEFWVDKSAWSSGLPQVAGGKLYSGGPNPAWLTRAIGSFTTMKVSAPITISGAASTGLVLVGLDALNTSNTGMLAVGIDAASRVPTYWRGSGIGGSGQVNLNPAALVDGTYTASVEITAADAIVTIGPYSATIPLSSLGVPMVNLRVWNSDNRQLSGHAIGQLTSTTTGPVSAGTYEGATESVVYTKPNASASSRVRVELPKTYVSDTPAPLVVYCHGSGRDAASGFDDTQVRLLTNGLTSRGYIVVHADAGGTTNWGNQAALDGYVDAYRYVRDHYGISAVYMVGQSMGGLASLTIVAKKLIPGVLGWFGVNPVTNLRGIYDGGLFKPYIEGAYGMTTGAPEWNTATEGYDPNLRPAGDFAGVAYRVLTSADDATVPPASNSDLLLAKVAPVAPEATKRTFPGTVHIGNESFDAADADAFFKRCATY